MEKHFIDLDGSICKDITISHFDDIQKTAKKELQESRKTETIQIEKLFDINQIIVDHEN